MSEAQAAAVANPYAAPESDLIEARGGNSERLAHFTRFSAWGYFGLTLVTLGFYVVWWLYSRRKEFAQAVPEQPVSQALVTAAIIAMVVSTVLSYGGAFAAESLIGSGDGSAYIAVNGIGSLISLIYIVLYLVVIFKYRNRLQTLVPAGSGIKVGPIMTFFFQGLYLQYKINELIDNQQASESSLSV